MKIYNQRRFDPVTGKWKNEQYKLTRDEVEYAIKSSDGNIAAARFLNIHPDTWKKYASKYVDLASGKTLFELHDKQGQFGDVRKKRTDRIITVQEIIDDPKLSKSFGKMKFQELLISEGHVEECCAICKFNERRITDYKIPLLLMWKDGDRANCQLENLELVCFNHAYLYYNKTAPNMSCLLYTSDAADE